MNKVITINLNGRAYQLEESGYHALKEYLDRAASQLADDPDHDEIVADLEQALADKCDGYLKASKTVVTDKEIARIIEQMGPVDADKPLAARTKNEPKKFYLIGQGSIVGGVATGLASYFNLDVTVVRLLLIILAFATSGAAIAAYIVAMIIVPRIDRPGDSPAHSESKINSQELIDKARAKYREVSQASEPALQNFGSAIRSLLRGVSGVVGALGLIALLGITVAGVSGVWSLAFGGDLFGINLAFHVTAWLLGLLLACSFLVAIVPLLVVTILALKYARTGGIGKSALGLVAAAVIFSAALSLGVAIFSGTTQLRNLPQNYTYQRDGSGRITCIGYCGPMPTPTATPDRDLKPFAPPAPQGPPAPVPAL